MNKPKKFAVILAGCGSRDGAEIHESVMALYAIDRAGSTYEVFAPDINQYHVVNHYTGEVADENRNVLVEAARIARGKISPLSRFDPENFDILLFSGGFGVAKNLCTYAFDGPDHTVNPEVAAAVRGMHRAGKPIGAFCIAPVILARVLEGVTVTLGQDPGAIANAEKMGAVHQKTGHGEATVDPVNKIVTTPCYMLDARISDIANGAMKAVEELVRL